MPLRHSLKKALIGIVHAAAHILATLRVQTLPQRETFSLAQLQDMTRHDLVGNVLSAQSIVAPLKRDEVVPDRRRHKYPVPQLAVLLVAAVESILVGSADFDRIAHALTPFRRRVGGNSRSATHTLFLPTNKTKCKQFAPYIPKHKCRGFTAQSVILSKVMPHFRKLRLRPLGFSILISLILAEIILRIAARSIPTYADVLANFLDHPERLYPPDAQLSYDVRGLYPGGGQVTLRRSANRFIQPEPQGNYAYHVLFLGD